MQLKVSTLSIAASLVLAAGVAAASAALAPAASSPGSRQEVTFVNAAVSLSGSLLLPKGQLPFPAVVFLHGSGDEPRGIFEELASRLSAAGYAALIFDKRGNGKSSGSWKTSSLDDLAEDGAAAVRFLAGRSEIDAHRIGVLATSQSGWYAPIVADRSPVSFLIVVTGGGASPREVEWYGYENALTRRGVLGQERQRARDLVRRYLDYLATGEGYEALRAAIAEAKKNPWYEAVPVGNVLPNEADRRTWSWVGTFNPSPSIEKLRVPALLFFGGKDPFTPPSSLEAWTNALARSAANATIRVFPEAGHGMILGDHGHALDPSKPKRWAVGFLETIVAWLNTLPSSKDRFD
jgi:pimeloyl-ACP methyl ester carboxylesterase